MRIIGFALALVLVLRLPAGALAEENSGDDRDGKSYEEQDWAVGAVLRTASIPFATDEGPITTFIPLIHFENDRFFFRTLEGGVKVYRQGDWQLSALGRLRFFDFPPEYQNQLQGDTMDFGAQVRYRPTGPFYLDLEFMSDLWGRNHFNLRGSYDFTRGQFRLTPFAGIRIKNSKFNTRYYGLDMLPVDSGTEFGLGAVADMHLWGSLYVIAAARFTRLDSPVRGISFVNDQWHNEGFLGFGLTNDPTRPHNENLSLTAYLRLALGWATPSSLADIFQGKADDDPYNNQMTSIFYGYPLTNRLVGLPLDLYLHSGFVWHWKSSVQDHAQEFVLAIKLFYTIKWPVRWRLGAAEGLSYVNKIPYVEKTELAKKGYEPSNLLNFLDFSLDLNLGDIAGADPLRRYWLGVGIHHRSAIFETAQQFGRIKGGSNFQTIFLKRHF